MVVVPLGGIDLAAQCLQQTLACMKVRKTSGVVTYRVSSFPMYLNDDVDSLNVFSDALSLINSDSECASIRSYLVQRSESKDYCLISEGQDRAGSCR